MALLEILLAFMRLVMFSLALGLTLISFQSYRKRQTTRLEYAFIGFAFISMGTAVMTLNSQFEVISTVMSIVQAIPFIVGFSMLYLSLYR
jgi:multisubunit Na+/H+ antiporter MnhB subunit